MTSRTQQHTLKRFEVPEDLHRNSREIAELGYENTGQQLIDLAQERCGFDSLADVRVLDVGCGVRFAMTIVNRRLAIKSYTGLEVNATLVDFLNDKVAAHDGRFRFRHWDAYNEMYNPGGISLSQFQRLPIAETFDVIWAYSVFTHQNPSDSSSLLRLLRKNILPAGKLFFSAFIDDSLDGFDDRAPETPLLLAYYGRNLMESLIVEAGWRVEGFYERGPVIMQSFLCSPA